MTLTQNLLGELFYYEDGKLFNKTKRSKNTIVGEEAGRLSNRGYRQIMVNRKFYLSHRLIYIFHHGEIADKLYIDHIDRDKSNNNIENLRLVTIQENQWNRGARGYYFHKANNKFLAQIRLNSKLIHLGYFNTEEEARSAYLKAKEELHIIEERTTKKEIVGVLE
jgi:hypothetical protein